MCIRDRCMGVPWGAPDDLNTFLAMVNNVPADWFWSAFSIGRNQMAYVAASVLAGGNVRVGLEAVSYTHLDVYKRQAPPLPFQTAGTRQSRSAHPHPLPKPKAHATAARSRRSAAPPVRPATPRANGKSRAPDAGWPTAAGPALRPPQELNSAAAPAAPASAGLSRARK